MGESVRFDEGVELTGAGPDTGRIREAVAVASWRQRSTRLENSIVMGVR